jgi:hypothetical protein
MRALLLYGAPRRDALAAVSDAPPRAESSDIRKLKWLARAREPRAAEKVVPPRMETLADISAASPPAWSRSVRSW